MNLSNEEKEFIAQCLTFYMECEERFVSYDEHIETNKKVNEILFKITTR